MCSILVNRNFSRQNLSLSKEKSKKMCAAAHPAHMVSPALYFQGNTKEGDHLFICLGRRQGEAVDLNCNPLQRLGIHF